MVSILRDPLEIWPYLILCDQVPLTVLSKMMFTKDITFLRGLSCFLMLGMNEVSTVTTYV